MKKIMVLLLLSIFLATSVFAMASNQGCQKTNSCYNIWQCYGSTVAQCQSEAQQTINYKTNAKAYWDAVGACQAKLCASYK